MPDLDQPSILRFAKFKKMSSPEMDFGNSRLSHFLTLEQFHEAERYCAVAIDSRYHLQLNFGGMNMRNMVLALGLLAFGMGGVPGTAGAQEFTVTIKNHRFEPAEVRVPAGKRITLTVSNEDSTPEEFESHSLKVEKIIPGKSKGVVRFGPLKPGRYEFFGEFHESTAKGVVIAE